MCIKPQTYLLPQCDLVQQPTVCWWSSEDVQPLETLSQQQLVAVAPVCGERLVVVQVKVQVPVVGKGPGPGQVLAAARQS
jgi:hypothetical protein